MIPKIFHHIWLGDKTLPKQEEEFIDSFKKHYPDWEFILWDNDRIKELEMPSNCQEAFDIVPNWEKQTPCYSCQSDVIRWLAVYEYGGIYADTDVECFKSIEEFITEDTDLLAIKPHSGNWLASAFFGASKNFKLLKNMIEDLKPRTSPHNGPLFLTRHLYELLSITWRSALIKSPKDRAKVETLNRKNIKVLSHEIWGHKNPRAYMKHYFKASWKKCE